LPNYSVGVELSKVRFLNTNIGWAAGWHGYVAKTSNGATWQLVNIGTTEDHLFDVVPVSQNEIWLCGREDFSFDGVVYHSTNGGQSWSRQVGSPGSEATCPYRFTALPTGDAWYGGYAGRIARRQTATTEVRPNALTMIRGIVRSGSLTSVLESDDSRLEMRPGPVFTTTMTPLVAEFTGQGPSGNLSRLDLVVESSASSPVVQVVFQMVGYDVGTFVDVGSANSTTTDHTYTFELANPNRFTSPAGEIKCRINYKALGANLMYPWLGRLDLIRWRAHM
jgi:hypothetical protein